MNGLKLIRIRCNYSQAQLAEKLNVSRAAVNMWENSRKALPEMRANELCKILGITDIKWLGEIDEDLTARIKAAPLYRTSNAISEHFSFSPTGKQGLNIISPTEEITLDERCSLKRLEIKAMLNNILEYSEGGRSARNSYGRISRICSTQKAIEGTLELLKTATSKSPDKVMIYIHTIYALLDAANIAFGNISTEELPDTSHSTLAIRLSKEMTAHIEQESSKLP